MQVWKFPLPDVEDIISVRMPMYSEILCLQLQWNPDSEQMIPTLWAIAGDKKTENGGLLMVDVNIHIVGTGWDFDASGKQYIGTVQLDNLVWHYWLELQMGASISER